MKPDDQVVPVITQHDDEKALEESDIESGDEYSALGSASSKPLDIDQAEDELRVTPPEDDPLKPERPT